MQSSVGRHRFYAVLVSFERTKTLNNQIKENVGLELSWLERTPDKRKVDGPSPSRPTISSYNKTAIRKDALHMGV